LPRRPPASGREPRDRDEKAMVAVTAPISPELALVCPELAEEARAALPDRPWEAFLPVLRPAAHRPPPLVPAAPAEPGWPGRLAAALPMLLLVVFTAVIVVGTLPWLGDRPTLGPPGRTPATPIVKKPVLPTITVRNSNEEQLVLHGSAAAANRAPSAARR
jgi:hypothetical protein